MLVLGIIVIVGLGLHLFNFWAKMQLPELMHNMGMHADTLTLAYAANGAYQDVYKRQISIPVPKVHLQSFLPIQSNEMLSGI